MNKSYMFTSESVSEGHPDKVADLISDHILDAYLTEDSHAKVACETLVTTNTVIISGEINSSAQIDIERIIRNTLKEIGYVSDAIGMNASTCKIVNLLEQQSPDIAQGVIKSNGEIGAGDQGIMFGYAENSNETFMPLPIVLASEIVRRASIHRKNGAFKHALPDMKSQVTLLYAADKIEVKTVVCSIQHEGSYDKEQFKKYLETQIIDEVLADFKVSKTDDYQLFFNPTGRFVIGGPHGDTGLTGRKIIVDTYGGIARHGGGAFSGKDATKVDRSAAYMARFLAKNIVASGLAEKCEIQLAYAIGVSQPLAIYIDTFGTGKVEEQLLIETIFEHIDLSPSGIIETLNLRQPIFSKTAAYGHFGRTDITFPWEELTLVDIFSNLLDK